MVAFKWLLFNSIFFYSDKHDLSKIYKQRVNQIYRESPSKLNFKTIIFKATKHYV